MKKTLITTLLTITLLATLLIGCSSEPSTNDDVKNPTESETPELPDETDPPADVDTDVDVDIDTEVDTDTETGDVGTSDEDSKEEEEEVVEMVDWETWATQADNDEVCLVVWNEQTGTQKILEPMSQENFSSYVVEEGDRFAVPRKDSINYILVGFDERFYWESEEQKYMELEIPVGESSVVDIAWTGSEYTKTYLFN